MATLLGGLAAAAGGARAPIEAGASERVPLPPEAPERQPLRPDGPQESACETFPGDVADGEAFERPFGDGLLFRLRPTAHAPPNPRGWTIEVRATAEEGQDHDFVWVATPPYRFLNPRYLDTSHGRTATEAVAWWVRSFGFVTSEEEYEELADVVGFVTTSRPRDMPSDTWKARYDSLRGRWSAMMDSVGQGELRITDAEVTGPEEAPPGGRIERIAFEVALCPGGGDPTDALGGPHPSRPPFDSADPVDPPEEDAPAAVSDSAVGQEAHQDLPEAGRVRRVGDGRLSADTVVPAPDTESSFWRVDPAEGRFGPVDGGTTESELRDRVGDSRVERTDVYLAEGACTVGVRVFPGTPWAFEVAWADSGRSRPAFARVTRDGALSQGAASSPGRARSPFRTAKGVRLGTSLDELEAMAGGPVRFSGFGWDYGGRAAWTDEGGELVLRLFYDPERLGALQAGADSSRLDALFGDRRVRSDQPLVERLGIRVVSMRLDWRSPEAVRFCG